MNIKRSGKVRDIYEINALALTTTDRVSAYDSVLEGTVPYKGIILQTISNKWMEKLKAHCANHIITTEPKILKILGFEPNSFGKTVLVEKHLMIPIECIVRGYYIPTSSSWNSYKINNTIQGITLPPGLEESEKLPEPIFTPTTKGDSDIPIAYEEMLSYLVWFIYESTGSKERPTGSEEYIKELASRIAKELKNTSIKLYTEAYSYAKSKGIILADTKLEFGIKFKKNSEGFVNDFELILCDEAFTPDSSRYWDAKKYNVGKTQDSMDKQYLRDYLKNELHWTGVKDGPVPKVPVEVYEEVSGIYGEILYRLFDIDICELTTQLAYQEYEA